VKYLIQLRNAIAITLHGIRSGKPSGRKGRPYNLKSSECVSVAGVLHGRLFLPQGSVMLRKQVWQG
jgi:hypothetical protein